MSTKRTFTARISILLASLESWRNRRSKSAFRRHVLVGSLICNHLFLKSQITIQKIESIHVYTNSMSVFYGNQAVAGVINIITTSKIQDQKNISISLGSYDRYQADISLSHQLSNGLAYKLGIAGLDSKQYRVHNNKSNGAANLVVTKQFNRIFEVSRYK